MELPAPHEPVDVERILRSMTVEEKVGQLLFVGFGGTEVNSQMEFWVQQRHVGGIALFSRNIVNLAQTAKLTRGIHALTENRIPVFVALDQEGGNVVRVKDGAMTLPGNMALGATRSTRLAYIAGQGLAVDLKLLGFNMNLAPVLDVNSNPKNPVIGVRSYGEKPELVSEMGSWYVRGQQEMGVVAVAKHFPGHGDTHTDSHFAMPAISADMKRLSEVELAPFKAAMDVGLDAIMTAHIALPRVAEEPNLPATLSKNILTGVLREKLGFQGVVITDGLEMDGIVERYGSGRASVMAVNAGADMPLVLWQMKKKDEVYDSLLAAVRSGEIKRERLDQSVRRILQVKARRGLFDRKIEPLERAIVRDERTVIHEQATQQIAREAVTLVRNHADALPLRAVRYRKVVVLATPGPFGARLAKEKFATVIVTPFQPSREQREADIAQTIAAARDADMIVFGTVNRYHLEMAKRVMRSLPNTPATLVSFASPYYLESVPEVDAYVCTYSYLDDAQRAAAEGLMGMHPMTGRLPVTIPGYYAYGHRVEDHAAHAAAETDTTQ
ncbi:MAG: beta-N-acetylhexosaminidase [Clostridia bacterium]|nr:beta-N-acetylhexosaminidase [Deltaproteobacteria bacterium]